MYKIFNVIVLALITFIILYTHHHYFQNSFITQTETQYPLNNNSSFLPSHSPGNQHCIFCMYDFEYS